MTHQPVLILVVEDDIPLARLMDALLVSEGYRVRTVHDGFAALDTIQQESPALVLLDLTLPRMDGWDVLERVRALANPPPVALLTGHASVATRARDAGAATLVQKPFDIDELLQIVATLLGDTPVE